MVKHSNKLKRADRRAPDPGVNVDDFEPTPTIKPSEPYKSFQHNQQQSSSSSKKKSGLNVTTAVLGKTARIKKAKAIERADKTNQKFVINKAKAERKKLMKS